MNPGDGRLVVSLGSQDLLMGYEEENDGKRKQIDRWTYV
jgi:hypothetical protein